MKTKIFAHRGASNYAPENTMPAFKLALDMEADGIETDVQPTKDEIPVLIHDETLKRTTNGLGLIKDHTWEELSKLDAGRYFSPKYIGTTIPTLDEFLEWASAKPLHLNLELKNNKVDYKGLEAIVLDALRKYGLKERVTISSFNSASVTRIRKLDRALDVALLASRTHENLPDYAKGLGASSLHVKHTLVSESLIRECLNIDLPLRVYTVNRGSLLKKMFNKDIDGIITDVPDKAVRIQKGIR